MGGNGPIVVMDDADVDAAVEATLTACYLCAGQSCTAGERILVHRAVQDEFVEKLARAVTERILLGDPFDDATTMGPLNNEGVAVKMDEHVADAVERGATVISGGARASSFATDLYWEPTILAGVPSDARVATDETFGPIAPVVAIDSLERGDRADERLTVRAARGDLHRRPRAPGWSSPTASTPAGSTSTSRATTGSHTCPSAAVPAATAASAASGAIT